MYSKEKIIQTMHEIYEESLEISPYVIIAQPRRDKNETAAQNLDGYEGLHIDLLGVSHGFCDISGQKVDVARNYLIEQALQSGAKYLLFVGEDTVLPYNGYKKLHETAEKNPDSVVVGVYYIKISDPMIMVKEGNWIKIPDVSPGQVLEAWQTGMDAMLIPISILQKLKEEEPDIPFCCIGNNIEDIPFIGEDNFFVYRLRKAGYKLLVDTDVQCLHIDLATGKYTAHPSVDLNNYYTNIPITEPLTLKDKEFIDKRWVDRLPQNNQNLLEEYIKSNKPIRFNMGAGRDKLDGYISVDKYNPNADIKQDIMQLSLPNNCADEILASHVIEHLPHFKIKEVLTSWYSTLKPEGKLILEQPNLEELCKDFENADDQERYLITLCIYGAFANYVSPESIENGTASPHIWGYYPKILKEILVNIGYKNIEILPQQGQHPGKNFRIEAYK